MATHQSPVTHLTHCPWSHVSTHCCMLLHGARYCSIHGSILLYLWLYAVLYTHSDQHFPACLPAGGLSILHYTLLPPGQPALQNKYGLSIVMSGSRRRWAAVARVVSSAPKSSIRRFVITEKAPTRAFSWLKAATTAFTFKTLLRHYANWALTPRSLNVKLGP